MTKDLIYCDQAATSFPKPAAVVEAVSRAMTEFSGSPGRSAHQYSLEASRMVFEARESAAALLGVDDSARIVFGLNVTQALNLALNGFLRPGDHVLTGSMEHNSVMRPLMHLARSRGVAVEVVPADPRGRLDPAGFAARLRKNTRLGVVNHVSNVVGTIAPVREIKSALGGVPLLLDAAQSAGVLDLRPAGDLADLVAFTGHKSLFGPTGAGGLWVRPGLEIQPLFRGGSGSRSEREDQPEFLPDALEAGTPNTHGLAGLAAGINFVLETGPDRILSHERELVRVFLDGLGEIKGVEVFGPRDAARITAVVSIAMKDRSPSDLAFSLARKYGVLTRAGLHCAPRAHRIIGSFPQGLVRFSFGWFNTIEDVEAVLTALDKISREAA